MFFFLSIFPNTMVLIHRKSNCAGYIDCGEPVPGSNTVTEVSSSTLIEPLCYRKVLFVCLF